MPPEVVAQIRGILVAKETAAPAERRKLSAALPGLGFRIRDFAEHVPSHRGGFSVADFDLLVEKGVIRIGIPRPRSGSEKGKAKKAKASDNGSKAAAPEPEPDPEPDEPPARALEPRFRPPPQPSPDQLVRNGLRLAFGAARWARRRLR